MGNDTEAPGPSAPDVGLESPERPVAGPPVIGMEGELRILRELLRIEQERLRQALELEAKRSIVFPETTVILHDVERLLAKVREQEESQAERETAPGIPRQPKRKW